MTTTRPKWVVVSRDIGCHNTENRLHTFIYAEHVTPSNGLSCVQFLFPGKNLDSMTPDQHESLLRFQLIRMQARDQIFCASNYDQHTTDEDGSTVNKMLQSRKVFETTVTHPTYHQIELQQLQPKHQQQQQLH